MKNNNITLINYRGQRMVINSEVLNNLNFDFKDFFEIVEYNMECQDVEFNVETIQEFSSEESIEYVQSLQPIYYNEISEAFAELTITDINNIIKESGYIEFNEDTDFGDIMSMILMYRDLTNFEAELIEVFDNVEFIQFDKAGYEQVKNDILNYLDMYQDITIEQEAERYIKRQNTTIEGVLLYICGVCYCSYAVVGEGRPLPGWEIYQYYCNVFINDEDLKQAVKNYII